MQQVQRLEAERRAVLLGVGGALLAGFLGQQLNWYRPGEGAGFLAAIVGAILILIVYRFLASRR